MGEEINEYLKINYQNSRNFVITKVDKVSNIKLFIYYYPAKKIAAGGSWSIVGIKDNNETIVINRESV